MKPLDPEDPAPTVSATEPLADRAIADAERVRLVRAIHAAITLVRVYRTEEGAGGERERECLAEVARLREVLSSRRRARVVRNGGPGLAKADEPRETLAPHRPKVG